MQRGGGIQRATSKRARRGYGRDKRGPPHSKKNRDKGVNGRMGGVLAFGFKATAKGMV